MTTSPPTQDALEPCPFCGGVPFDRGFRRWECGGCGAQGPAGTKEQATVGWNRRALATPINGEDREVVAAVERLSRFAIEGVSGNTVYPGGIFNLSPNLFYDDLRACLRALASRGGVPAGWKLVPVETTEEIAEAIASVVNVCGGIADSIWTAAIAASPPIPVQSGEGKAP